MCLLLTEGLISCQWGSMLPVVALVGRPNVGKSTLFNRLTRTQDALVADFPGLTRDRQYGQASANGAEFIVVDTGGIGVDDAAVDALMSRQSASAIEEADCIFFLVDARSGITGVDRTIADRLRRVNKPVYVVVNKAESLDEDVACSEFHAFGFSAVFPISAAHGRGIADLLAHFQDALPAVEAETPEASEGIRIAFVGRPNVGKSTLINRMLGEERVVVYDMPGTTRDSIAIPFSRDGHDYVLVDTAGVRRRSRVDEKIEKFSIIKTLQAIREANVCVVLIDAQEGLTEQGMHLLGFVIEAGKGLVVAVNKWDGLSDESRKAVMDTLERRLQFTRFATTRTISALHGSGVGVLFRDIEKAYASATQSLSTPHLTRLLQELVTRHAPPLVNGRRIKLRYAHAGGHNPPVIVIHGNQLGALPDSYKRYLTNAFVEALNMVGTPLKLEFRGGENPYRNKPNKLSARQVNRKKRLMRHVKRKK
ncbi:GTP-binding protein EngA [Legionella geestiana]|nr:GTP-binding protein EngA [Legionella geestiana]